MVQKVGTSRCDVRTSQRGAPTIRNALPKLNTLSLDFLRELRIKTLRKIMERSFRYLLQVLLSTGLVLLVTGCGEDPRYSGNTQYLGGTYGGVPATGPRDTVSYWDGDHASGSPSIKISLGEQRAYFYKSGVLVGVSQLSTGRDVTLSPKQDGPALNYFVYPYVEVDGKPYERVDKQFSFVEVKH